MKLLVIEYICSGAFYAQPLPATLAAEGRLMLQAILDELKFEPNLDVLVPLDPRCMDLDIPDHVQIFPINTANFSVAWEDCLASCDTVLLVAPESDAILANLVERMTAMGKSILLSDSASIRLCTNKWLTYQTLMRAGIPAVPTVIKDFSALPQAKAYVRKPIDGLSCEGSFIFSDLQLAEEGDGIVQPLIEGHALSLSAVFSQGRSWLLSCNQQQITVVDSSFKLQGCRVNIPIAQPRHYEDLLQTIAQAFPGLWGYIGIDFMESERYGIQILEINPRLTTSYAGLYQATGIRMLAQLLRLFTGQDVDFQAKWNKTTHISITGVCQSCTTM